jgi:hypothetical protein
MGFSPIASGALALLAVFLLALARLGVVWLARPKEPTTPSPAYLGRKDRPHADLGRSVSRISQEISAMRQAQGDDHATLVRLKTIVDLQGSALERITQLLAAGCGGRGMRPFPAKWVIDFLTGTLAGLVATALYQWLSGT